MSLSCWLALGKSSWTHYYKDIVATCTWTSGSGPVCIHPPTSAWKIQSALCRPGLPTRGCLSPLMMPAWGSIGSWEEISSQPWTGPPGSHLLLRFTGMLCLSGLGDEPGTSHQVLHTLKASRGCKFTVAALSVPSGIWSLPVYPLTS